ncbi:MAG: hypothetical protein NTV51_02560 [Verrucomicrobia bacterium]|nr:hypothetical protein [Verrucomicrobiota bacterium]
MPRPSLFALLGSACAALLLCAWPASVAADTSGITIAGPPPPLVPLPKDRPYELRVLHLVDPRLPTLTADQRRALHTRIEVLLQSWYGYTVTLREVGVRDLAANFAASEAVFARHADLLQLDIDPATGPGRARLRATVRAALARHPLPLIATHLQSGPLTSQAQAVELAFNRFLSRLKELQSIPVANGEPFSIPSQRRLNSYAHWCAHNYDQAEADFIFTNSMIVGADAEMPLYVIARGGVSAGNTNGNLHNAFHATGMVSLFPFLSDAPFWLRERGPLPEAERLDVVATLALHELGHFFLRLAEASDHPHCVHVAPPGFRFLEWHRAIREHGPCPLPHPTVTSY